MKLQPRAIYHIYNRGNNKDKIFFTTDNYLFFLKKIRVHLRPFADILCYCLMPNHFHIMIATPDNFNQTEFVKNYRILLSSYTRAINIQENKVGSLFQQHSHCKLLEDFDEVAKSSTNNLNSYWYFNYIHQNPLRAKLVHKAEDWPYSSLPDYLKLRDGTLCSQKLACELIGLPDELLDFYQMTYDFVEKEKIEKIF